MASDTRQRLPWTRFALLFLAGVVLSGVTSAEHRTIYEFKAPYGATPSGALIQASDGNFYGTTYDGGEHDGGTVFRMTPDGTLTTLHSFNRFVDGGQPIGPLVLAADGNFYGTNQYGGAPQGQVTQQDDGGTIFRVTPAGTVSVVHAFRGGDGGWQPSSGLALGADGVLYGTTRTGEYYENGSGVIFSVTTSGTFTVLHKFPGTGNGFDGNEPRGPLLYASDGNLYGMAAYGGNLIEGTQLRPCGNAGCGVIYRITPAGEYTKLYEFKEDRGGSHPMTGLIEASDGYLYGMTSYDHWPNIMADGTSVFRASFDGEVTYIAELGKGDVRPNERLLEANDGNFYLTTPTGGPCLTGSFCGRVLRVTPAGEVSEVHAFDFYDGAAPGTGLIQASDGHLYAVTQYGGRSENGTVFKLALDGTLTTLNHFDNIYGAYPTAGLVRDAAGDLYGTTYLGGAVGLGTVFRVTSAGALTVLHSFSGTDGAYPRAGLRLASDGNFYGTTEGGGTGGYGTVFVMTPEGEVTLLHSFDGFLDGAFPQATLTEASDGKLYGTAEVGGSGGYGTVFSITPYDVLPGLSGQFLTVATFDYLNGAYPVAGVVEGPDGNFYGAAADGGPNTCGNSVGCGTFYKLTPNGILTTLHFFNCCLESQPFGTPIVASDGNFYGTTNGVLSQRGTVYRVTPAGALSTLYSFNSTPLEGPFAGVIEGADGALYGTTLDTGYGHVFRLTLAGDLTVLHSFDDAFTGNKPYGVLVEGEPGHFYGTVLTGGADSGTLAIPDRGQVFEVVVKPELNVPVTSLAAGNVVQGGTGGNGFTLTATGNAPVTLDFSISGDAAFTQINDCNGGLTAYRQCNVFVYFKPVATGPHSGTLTITSNDADSPHVITLSGTGTPAAVATPTPSSLTFADRNVGTTSDPQTIVFENTGSLSLNLGPFSTGTNEYPVSHNCGTLAPGAECTVSVRFAPAVPGSRPGSLIVFCSPNCQRTVPLSGTGVGATATLSPDPVAFPDQPVGTPAARDVTLTNYGNIGLEIAALAISGDFAQTNTCGNALPAASSCTITVQFNPTATGYRDGYLTVASNAFGSPHAVRVYGHGTGATASPLSLAFGDQAVGTTSVEKYVTVGNTGSTPFNINGISTTGDFSYTSGCGASLGGGSSCLIAVRFAPGTAAALNGTLTIDCASGSCPREVALSGTGRAPAMSVGPPTLTFADRTVGTMSPSQAVTLTNMGNVSTPIGLTLSGDYTMLHDCGANLTAGASCTVNISFAPTAAGARNGTLSVASSAAGSPSVVTLTGAGVVGAVTLAPTALAFGEQAQGTASETQPVTLTNSGAGILTIQSIGTSGDFTQSHTCGATLAPGVTCVVSVRFAPATTGLRTGSLNVSTSAPGSPHGLSLSGTGVAASSGGGGGAFGACIAWLFLAGLWRVWRSGATRR